MSQDSSINDSSLMLDDSITFSNRFDFEETIRQIQEQSKKVSSHLSQYSKYLAPSPKVEKVQPQVEQSSNVANNNNYLSLSSTNNKPTASQSTTTSSRYSTAQNIIEPKQLKTTTSITSSSPSPVPSSSVGSKNVQSTVPATPLTSKYSPSDPIEALMRDFRNEVKDIDNSMISSTPNDTPNNSSYKYHDTICIDDDEDVDVDGHEEEPEYTLYNTSTPINESVKKSNRLITESMSKYMRMVEPSSNSSSSNDQYHLLHPSSNNPSAASSTNNRLLSGTTNLIHNNSAFSPILNSVSSKISQTSSPIITFSTAEKSRVSDPDIMFTPQHLGSGLFSSSSSSHSTTMNQFEKPKQTLNHHAVAGSGNTTSQSTLSSNSSSSEMLLRIENIQLRDEISKLNATVVSLQSRMEGMEKSMKQLFDLLSQQKN